MNTLLGILTALALTSLAPASPAHYTFTPDSSTSAGCRSLKMTGPFQLWHDSEDPKYWDLVFQTGAKQLLRRVSNGYYKYAIGCSAGCTGYAETWLNLNTKQFYYWDSINRSHPDFCKGSVTVH